MYYFSNTYYILSLYLYYHPRWYGRRKKSIYDLKKKRIVSFFNFISYLLISGGGFEYTLDTISIFKISGATFNHNVKQNWHHLKKRIRKHIFRTIVWEKYKNILEISSFLEEFFREFGLSTELLTTIPIGISYRRWILYTRNQKRTYFSDKHESEENFTYQEKVLYEYFDLELISYR